MREKVAERDADWTDDENDLGVEADAVEEQEEATVETENFVDTVLDVYVVCVAEGDFRGPASQFVAKYSDTDILLEIPMRLHLNPARCISVVVAVVLYARVHRYEEALAGLKIREAEFEAEKRAKLDAKLEAAVEAAGGVRSRAGEAVLKAKARERRASMSAFSAASLARRAEAAHGAVVVLHDLGMPYYTLQHAEKAAELADAARAKEVRLGRCRRP